MKFVPYLLLAAALIVLLGGIFSATARQKAFLEASSKAGLSSVVTDGIGYISVEQKLPNETLVKKVSVFLNAIQQTAALQQRPVVNATPVGEPVMLDGEVAYPAMMFFLGARENPAGKKNF